MGDRRLYTEDSVRALRPGSELVLGAGAIATPAALDLAFARGIRVRWEDGSTSPAAAPPAQDLWQRMLSSEGDFIVQVHGGRAAVFRLTPDGPVPFGDTSAT